jgi:hypothetical protein
MSPGSHSYSELEAQAKDFARRFMNTSGSDVENIREMVGQGAQKLQEYLQRYAGQM